VVVVAWYRRGLRVVTRRPIRYPHKSKVTTRKTQVSVRQKIARFTHPGKAPIVRSYAILADSTKRSHGFSQRPHPPATGGKEWSITSVYGV
jgi:hypothetical protein